MTLPHFQQHKQVRHEISKTVKAKRGHWGREIVHGDLRSRPRWGFANRMGRRHRLGA